MSQVVPAAPSSLMSSRWSRDNLLTSHPGRLYDGRVLERIELESLPYLVEELQRLRGPCELGWGHMGVFTWDAVCESEHGQFILQLPRVLDEPGRRGRCKREVPRLNFEHSSGFIASGLKRFVSQPKGLVTLAGVPAAIFEALPGYRTLTFGLGAVQVELSENNRSWAIGLGADKTADLLAEMIAALVYHYDPELAGGTAIADVSVNDGDFAVKRRNDGSFELRLTAVRARESGIGPSRLLLYLVQLMAYEDWSVNDELIGLPVLLGNPSLAFEGLVRGLRYRYRDLGLDEARGVVQAERWIEAFGHSTEGRAYRPWVESFLAGRLPPSFGKDLRERWWRLMPLQTKLGLLELEERRDPASEQARSARTLRTFLERLAREIGRTPEEQPLVVRLNELGRDGLLGLLEGAPLESREPIADELLARWPFRSLDQLLAQVPSAKTLRRMKSRLSFGRVPSETDEGTLASLSPLAKEDAPGRVVSNPELFSELALDPGHHAAAARTFLTFETYMDTALHDSHWGYYAHRVSIGQAGHFNTHPEEMSPHYGKWLAVWAFKAWSDLVAHGELAETAEFPVIEFGAGNGRLARDFLDAVAAGARARISDERLGWNTFATRVRYRIYERSAWLRERQAALLDRDALVLDGDARSPHETLERDFPQGLTGFVLSNELPDAFGVHKLILDAQGNASVALAIPRVELVVKRALGEELARRVEMSNETARARCGIGANVADFYLDAATYAELMNELRAMPDERRSALLAGLWFEETYVPAATVPEVAAHLRANAAQYALALAAENSGVVIYVNLHASRFITELASSLSAGFIVTLDYGDTSFRLLQGARRGDFPFRVYGDWQEYVPRPNDPYSAPGTQDLTADVNFTDFAQAAEMAGLQVVHFGPERDVAGDALPELLRESAARDSLARFLGNPLFKVLVLGKRPSDAFRSALTSPLALRCREQDVPKSRRQAIAAIEQRLRSLG